MAQYNNKILIMVLTAFVYFDKNLWKSAPNRDQQTVDTKPIKARSTENNTKTEGLL